MLKNDYIKKMESGGEIFSVMKLNNELKDTTKIDNNKNLKLVYCDAEMSNGKVNYLKKTFQSSSGFYICWEKQFVPPFGENKLNYSFGISIYHKPSEINEVIIFLNQFNKS
jgi:hypothetical protein